MEKKNDSIYDVIGMKNEQICDLFLTYFDNRLSYSVEKIKVEKISPTSLYVQSKRLEYAELTAKILEYNGLELFEPHIKVDSKGIKRFVPPPIVESRDDLFVLCDGTHRVYIAKKMGIKNLIVLVVRKIYKPLAGDITSWKGIQINNKNYRSFENFVNFNSLGMTGYSKFCNSDFMTIQGR